MCVFVCVCFCISFHAFVRFCSCLLSFCSSFFPLLLILPAIDCFSFPLLFVLVVHIFSCFLFLLSLFFFFHFLPIFFLLRHLFCFCFCSLSLLVIFVPFLFPSAWFLPIFVFLFRSLLPPLLLPLRPLLILRFSSIFLFLFGLCSLICLWFVHFGLFSSFLRFLRYSSSCLRFRFCFLVFPSAFRCCFRLLLSTACCCSFLALWGVLVCLSSSLSLSVCLCVCVCCD